MDNFCISSCISLPTLYYSYRTSIAHYHDVYVTDSSPGVQSCAGCGIALLYTPKGCNASRNHSKTAWHWAPLTGHQFWDSRRPWSSQLWSSKTLWEAWFCFIDCRGPFYCSSCFRSAFSTFEGLQINWGEDNEKLWFNPQDGRRMFALLESVALCDDRLFHKINQFFLKSNYKLINNCIYNI